MSSIQIIPRKILFGNPSTTSPQVSPDRKYLAYIAPYEGVLNVWVCSIGKADDRVLTRDRDRGVRGYFWAEDGRTILYLQDKGGDENWRLHATDVESGETRDLTPFDNVQVRIVDTNRHFPDQILIVMNKDDARVHDAYRLHLASGKLEQIAKNPGNYSDWMTDADFKLRAVTAMRADGGQDLLLRDSESSDWRVFASWDEEDTAASGPVSFSKDGRFLYMRDSRGSDTAKFLRFEISTGNSEVLAKDPQFDASSVVIHPETYKPQMIAFHKARMEYVILDESIREDVEALQKLHRGDFFLINRDHADRLWSVGFIADDGPVSYFLYNRENRQAEFLFDNRPELNQYKLAPMEPVRFTSRDGLTIHGYLTFPPGAERKNLPMVLNVHGGPWVRDTWGYDAEAQWLSNRGYACLQVNYRASTGYGKKFTSAGDKEWGGKAHDDLIDAVRWAVAEGYADPKRVAIYGGSYGGYAALAGATFTPDVFCCAIDLVGPSNLLSFIASVPAYWSIFLAQLHKKVGNPATEPDFLRSRSPLFSVDKIRIPMLIAQGANDPRVKQAESEQIVEAMKKKGIEHEYLLFPDEGHGFAKPENRMRFYAACEKFLARHLGGRVE